MRHIASSMVAVERRRRLWGYSPFAQSTGHGNNSELISKVTRRPASADRTACRQFQAVFPVITSSFPTNVIAHLHGLSMDLTVGRTVGPAVDSTVS